MDTGGEQTTIVLKYWNQAYLYQVRPGCTYSATLERARADMCQNVIPQIMAVDELKRRHRALKRRAQLAQMTKRQQQIEAFVTQCQRHPVMQTFTEGQGGE